MRRSEKIEDTEKGLDFESERELRKLEKYLTRREKVAKIRRITRAEKSK